MSKLINDNRFYRNGQDHRGGWIVTFADVKKRFGFKSLKIGKWVTAKEKEFAAAQFFDALCDLQSILQSPELLLSLRETLSLNYGTGGQYGVMAHYEPSSQTFALAKNAGPGAIAHEWFHAFDHYIQDKFVHKSDQKIFASDSYWHGATIVDHPLNEKLARCFDTIFYKNEQADLTEYVLVSQKADQEQGQHYYCLPYELAARAFEAFVQDAHIKNNFLASGTKKSKEALNGLYPQGEHRLRINQAFSEYFHHLSFVLYNRERANADQ
jgi:hypothetical protein